MCECGCGSSLFVYHLPAPGKKFYLLEFGGGCDDCETPSGLLISKVDKDDLEFSEGALPMGKGVLEATPISFAYGHELHKFFMNTLCKALGINDIDDAPEEILDRFDPDEFKQEVFRELWKTVRKSVEIIEKPARKAGGKEP